MSETPNFPRPSAGDLAIWTDLRRSLDSINLAQSLVKDLGKQEGRSFDDRVELKMIENRLEHARGMLGGLALAFAETIVERS